MSYNIKTITPDDWLNIINQEADPNLDKKEINYYKLENKYVVHLHSGYGNLISPFYHNNNPTDKELADFFNSATNHIDKIYAKQKDDSKSASSFLSFPGLK